MRTSIRKSAHVADNTAGLTFGTDRKYSAGLRFDADLKGTMVVAKRSAPPVRPRWAMNYLAVI